MRLQRIRNDELGRPPGAPAPDSKDLEQGDSAAVDDYTPPPTNAAQIQSKKRKAADDEEEEDADAVRKRSKAAPLPGFLPEGFFDDGVKPQPDSEPTPPIPTNGTPSTGAQEFKLASRPATPLKAPEIPPSPAKLPTVDEDEWAAFEADIAAAEVAVAAPEDAVITAAPMTTEEIAAKSREEEISRRKERAEAEREGDKEDAVRKLEEEFEEMGELEERVRRLKEKREALRLKDGVKVTVAELEGGDRLKGKEPEEEEEEEDYDEEEDDDWAGFRLRG